VDFPPNQTENLMGRALGDNAYSKRELRLQAELAALKAKVAELRAKVRTVEAGDKVKGARIRELTAALRGKK
jgi:hypothetical protein